MITFFACPKPFYGHTSVIQLNAIKSWTLLRPAPEIILVGDDEGVAETCKELGLIHIAEIDKNEYGTPLVNSIFEIGQARASQPIVCYINSDILLMSDFMRAVETVVARMRQFLVLGQRRDVEIKEAWNFCSAEWETDLRKLVARQGKLHAPTGIDFFCFPRGMYTDIPPFAIGRPGFDNWLVWRARSKGVPIVDITNATLIVHQNHESLYVIRKRSIPEVSSLKTKNDSGWRKSGGDWVELAPEAQKNMALLPKEQNLNVWAATWMIDRKGRLGRRRLTLKPAYLHYQLKCVVPLYWPAFGGMYRWLVSVAKAMRQYFDLKKHLGTDRRH